MTQSNNSERTIIQTLSVFGDYPFEAIECTARDRLKSAAAILPTYERRSSGLVLKALECYLQVTGRSLSLQHLEFAPAENLCRSFIGALYSTRFIEMSVMRRYVLSHAARALFAVIHPAAEKCFLADLPLSTRGASNEVQYLAAQFSSMTLNEEKTWVWQGWPSENRNGLKIWLATVTIGNGQTCLRWFLIDSAGKRIQ